MAATSIVSTKMVVLVVTLIFALITPTFSSRKVVGDGDESAEPVNSFLGCPNLMKQNMTMRVIEHIHASPPIKRLLRGSAKFVDCVAGKFCVCFNLRFPPLIYGCFAAIGGYCMAKTLRGQNLPCALHCANQITANNNQFLLGIYKYIYMHILMINFFSVTVFFYRF